MYKLYFSIIVCLILTSCRNTDINGKLDGMWQLTTIDYIDSISVGKKPERIYYSIQLHLINLRQAGVSPEYMGRFKQSKDSLIISDFRIYMEEDKLASVEELKPFGLSQTTTRFGIEKLSSSEMILKSDYARLRFRKW